MILPETREALQEIGKGITAEARYLLDTRKANASKTLREGLRYWITERKFGITLNVGARGPSAKYVIYADKGRGPGKMPPIDKIETWVKIKPVKLRNLKTGKFEKRTPQKIRSVAFLIARKIGREGSEGSDFYSDAIKAWQPEIDAVKGIIKADIKARIRRPR
jgi:hypothetical protein